MTDYNADCAGKIALNLRDAILHSMYSPTILPDRLFVTYYRYLEPIKEIDLRHIPSDIADSVRAIQKRLKNLADTPLSTQEAQDEIDLPLLNSYADLVCAIRSAAQHKE
jgi:hypothetical protein